MDGGAGLKLLSRTMSDTVARVAAAGQHGEALAGHAKALAAALQRVVAATQSAWSTGQPEDALANATPYLQAFGHLVLAWVWLDVALVAAPAGAPASAASQGRLQACHYFFDYELPKIDAWLSVVASRNRTCRDMRDEWF
jgi:butyryl-CoA dehydrogenase